MALKDASLQFPQQAEEIDALIQKRIDGKLRVSPLLLPYLDLRDIYQSLPAGESQQQKPVEGRMGVCYLSWCAPFA